MINGNIGLAVLLVLGLSSCGDVAPTASNENVSGTTEAVSWLSGTAPTWYAGTHSATQATATCPNGTLMVGYAFDIDTPMIKCGATTNVSFFGAANGTLLGIAPAVTGSNRAVTSFSENLSNGATSINTSIKSGWTFFGDYVDSGGSYHSEWFVRQGRNVFGHVCNTNYAVRAININSDALVCGT